MKKLLLSLAALIGFSAVNAATVNLSVADASDIKGTHYDKELKDDGSTKTNERWQPLESLVIDGYTFTFSYTEGEKVTAPALYLAAKHTIRLYKTSVMTITAPEGNPMTSINFICDGLSSAPTVTANSGTIAYANNGLTWTGEKVETLTFTFDSSVKIASFTISDTITETPTPSASTLLETSKATDIKGTHYDKELKDDGTTKSNERWQPLESLVIDGYTFNFSYTEGEKVTAPALYLAAKHTIRLYKDSKMTITAPGDAVMGTIKFNCDGLSSDPSATSAQGNVTYSGGSLTWSGTPVNEVSFEFGGTIKIVSLEVSPEEGTVTPPAQQEEGVYVGLIDGAADWTFENVTLPEELSYIWIWKEANGSKYLNGSAYKGAPYAAEALAISPEVSLANLIDAEVTFDHTANYQTNLREDCKFLIRPVGTPDWEELTIPTWPTAGNWTFVNCGNIDLSEYLGQTVQFAFKYVSTATGADTWEINKFIVRGEKQSGINETIANDAQIEYYDLNGRRVYGELNTGIYVKRQGNKVSKVLVK